MPESTVEVAVAFAVSVVAAALVVLALLAVFR